MSLWHWCSRMRIDISIKLCPESIESPSCTNVSSDIILLYSLPLQESANAVRSIVGGIELLMKLLAATEPTKYNVGDRAT